MFAHGRLKNGNGGDWYYSVLEYVDVLPKTAKSRMGLRDWIGVTEQVLKCCDEALLPAGIIHRDIKPDNVLLFKANGDMPAELKKEYADKNGEKYRICAKLTDTGLIKTLRKNRKTHETMPGILLGTPEFMAPEDASAAMYSEVQARSWQSDIYSTGATLYYYLTGMHAHQSIPTDDQTPEFAMLANLAHGKQKTLRPSETAQFQKYLNTEFEGKRARKKVQNWLDLVLAGMMWRDYKFDSTKNRVTIDKSKRYVSFSDCIDDLCAVKNGQEPKKILNILKQNKINQEKYTNTIFTHYTKAVPEREYHDAKYARKRQAKENKPGLVKKALMAGALALTAIVAGGTALYVTQPELVQEAKEYVMQYLQR
jgi:serine/threonine protein kinase